MKFTGKIWKTGNAHVITVPSDFIKHGELELSQEYEVQLEKKGESNDMEREVQSAGRKNAA